MTTREKITIVIDGLDIVAEALKSVTNQVEILAETAREVAAEWQRFQDEVPHQTGRLRPDRG